MSKMCFLSISIHIYNSEAKLQLSFTIESALFKIAVIKKQTMC